MNNGAQTKKSLLDDLFNEMHSQFEDKPKNDTVKESKPSSVTSTEETATLVTPPVPSNVKLNIKQKDVEEVPKAVQKLFSEPDDDLGIEFEEVDLNSHYKLNQPVEIQEEHASKSLKFNLNHTEQPNVEEGPVSIPSFLSTPVTKPVEESNSVVEEDFILEDEPVVLEEPIAPSNEEFIPEPISKPSIENELTDADMLNLYEQLDSPTPELEEEQFIQALDEPLDEEAVTFYADSEPEVTIPNTEESSVITEHPNTVEEVIPTPGLVQPSIIPEPVVTEPVQAEVPYPSLTLPETTSEAHTPTPTPAHTPEISSEFTPSTALTAEDLAAYDLKQKKRNKITNIVLDCIIGILIIVVGVLVYKTFF